MIGYHKKNFGIWSACIGFELRLWYNASGSGSWLKFSVFLDSFNWDARLLTEDFESFSLSRLIPRFKLVETTKLLSADAIQVSDLKERASNPQTILKFRPRISFDYSARNGHQPIEYAKIFYYKLNTRK